MNKLILYTIILTIIISNFTLAQWERFGMQPSGPGFGEAFYVTNDTIIVGDHFCNIFLSFDNGNNWEKIESKICGFGRIYIINNHLFIVSLYSGLCISSDFGKTWRKEVLKYGTNDVGLIRSVVCNKGKLFAATELGLFVSSDFGFTWEFLDIPDAVVPPAINIIARDSIIITSYGGIAGIWKSIDNGNTWYDISNDIRKILNSHSFHMWYLTFKGDSVIAHSDKIIFISTNSGDNWNILQNIFGDTLLNEIIFCNDIIYTSYYKTRGGISSQGFLFTSNFGKTWKTYNDGLPNLSIGNIQKNDKYIFALVGILGDDEIVGLYRLNIKDCEIVDATDVPDSRGGVIPHMQIYPNPATERVNIKITPFFPLSRGDIEVYDVFGERLFKEIPLYPPFAKGEIEVDVSGLAAGVYYVVVKVGGERITKKFAVVR